MPRKANLEPKTRVVRMRQKNGDIYILEQIVQYIPEKRYNKVLKSHLIGKIPAGESEIVPTRCREKRAMSTPCQKR